MYREHDDAEILTVGRQATRIALAIAFSLTLVTMLLEAAPAVGAEPVQTLSAAGQTASYPQVAVDAKGNAFAVWYRSDGTHTRIQLRRRSASGTLGLVRTLSEAGQHAESAQVAVDADGNAFVVWKQYDGSHWRIRLRRRSASGSLGPIQTLSAAGQSAGSPQVAIDRKGRAIIVWEGSDGAHWRIRLRRRSASGILGPIQTLSAAGQSAQLPQVAIDAKGNAFVVWYRNDGAHPRIQLRRRSASGTLGPVKTLSAAGQDGKHPSVAVDTSGNALVAWEQHDGAHWSARLRRRSASGSLSPVKTLSVAGSDAQRPRVAVDAKGNALVAWEGFDGANVRIQLRRRSASGTLGPVKSLSAAGQDAEHQQIAIDGKGNAVVVWERSDGSDRRIQLRRRSATGSLGPVRTLSAAGRPANGAQVDVDPKGNAYVVWGRSDGADWRIQGKRVAGG